ncbi:hypothetical protein [Cellulomonas hominis]
MVHPGRRGRALLRAFLTSWAVAGLLWLVALGAPTVSSAPGAILLPTALVVIAAAAAAVLVLRGFHLTVATTGPPQAVRARYRPTRVVWVGDPDVPGKPRPRAPGAGSSLR